MIKYVLDMLGNVVVVVVVGYRVDVVDVVEVVWFVELYEGDGWIGQLRMMRRGCWTFGWLVRLTSKMFMDDRKESSGAFCGVVFFVVEFRSAS